MIRWMYSDKYVEIELLEEERKGGSVSKGVFDGKKSKFG